MQQQIDDARKHGIDQLVAMEHKWGSYMGRQVYDDCRVSLKRPMQLLSVFEAAGKKKDDNIKVYEDLVKECEKAKPKLPLPKPPAEKDMFLSWTVPITNFPVLQNYTEGTIKKTWVQYGPAVGARLNTGHYESELQLAVCFIELPKPKRKQSQGASPNAIHSLDAAHLMLTVHNCDFEITTIHDSFGCLLSDMPKLFIKVRESFVELYKTDPLKSLIRDIDGDISNVEFGTLDISLVLDSEYCFA